MCPLFFFFLPLLILVASGNGFSDWAEGVVDWLCMLRHASCVERLRAFWGLQKGLCIGTLTATGTYIIRSGSILYSILRTFFLHKTWSRKVHNLGHRFRNHNADQVVLEHVDGDVKGTTISFDVTPLRGSSYMLIDLNVVFLDIFNFIFVSLD